MLWRKRNLDKTKGVLKINLKVFAVNSLQDPLLYFLVHEGSNDFLFLVYPL